MGVFTLLLVSAYLRPCSGLALRRRDLIPPTPGATLAWALHLHPTGTAVVSKTGSKDDTVILDSSYASFLAPIWCVLAEGPLDDLIFPFGYPEYLRVFRRVRKRLRLEDLVPYAARHSGPSIDRALNLRTSEEVRKRGGWASHKSMVRYEKAGRLAASLRGYPANLQGHVLYCESVAEAVLVKGQLELAVLPVL